MSIRRDAALNSTDRAFFKQYILIMDKIIIRPAIQEDLETLLQFEQGIIETERAFDITLKKGHINYYDIAELIKSPEAEVVVALDGEEVIGSGYALIKEAKPYQDHELYSYLGFMFIKPEYRGKGINRKILEALTQWSAGKGLAEMRLEVYAENESAIKAYEKAGFKPYMLQMRIGINRD